MNTTKVWVSKYALDCVDLSDLNALETVRGLLIAKMILVNRAIPLLVWQKLNTVFLTAI